MKKTLLLLAVILGLALYFSMSRYGVMVGGMTFALDKDMFEVERLGRRFLEDIQFKDFDHAAELHTDEDQAKKDIPNRIERKFKVKPEFLDMRSFELLRVELSDARDRGKVVGRCNVKLLNTGEVRDTEIISYWKKIEGKWFLDLQSSL